MTQSPCPIAATAAIAKSHFPQYRGATNAGRIASLSTPITDPRTDPGQAGQDRVYIPLSSCPNFVRLDKTPNCLLNSLRFFLSNRTKQRICRIKGLSGRIGQNRPKKGFCRGGRMHHLAPNPSPSRNHIKISLYLTPNPTPVSDVALRTKKPGL
jgi:hypothetical protein